MGFLSLGTVGAPHGLRGGFYLVRADRDDGPLSFERVGLRLASGEVVFRAVQSSFRSSSRCVLVLEGIATREAAESLRGVEILAERSAITVAEDEFLVGDLLDAPVLDEQNNPIGKVVAVHDFGAQTTLEIATSSGSTFLFPFLSAFVQVTEDPTGAAGSKALVIRQAQDFGFEGP